MLEHLKWCLHFWAFGFSSGMQKSSWKKLGLLGLWIRNTNTNTKQKHRRHKKCSHWQRNRGRSRLCQGPRSSGRTSESLGHAAPQLWLAPQFCICPAPSLFQTHTHTNMGSLSMLLSKIAHTPPKPSRKSKVRIRKTNTMYNNYTRGLQMWESGCIVLVLGKVDLPN